MPNRLKSARSGSDGLDRLTTRVSPSRGTGKALGITHQSEDRTPLGFGTSRTVRSAQKVRASQACAEALSVAGYGWSGWLIG